MSVTGHWVIGVVPPGTLEALERDVDTARFEPSGDTGLDWWKVMDHAALAGSGPHHLPSEAALRFADHLMSMRPDDEDLGRCLDVLYQSPKEGLLGIGERKGDPVATLYYGFRFDAARCLPGRFGCFLLDMAGVQTALASAGQILENPPGGRDAFTERASAWLEVMSGEDHLDPVDLLDGPLRILNRARDLEMGAVGVMQWF